MKRLQNAPVAMELHLPDPPIPIPKSPIYHLYTISSQPKIRHLVVYSSFVPLNCTSCATNAALNSFPASQSTQSGINTQSVLKKTRYNHK